MKKFMAVAAALVALASFNSAHASCAADSTLPAVKKAYADGQAQERAGKNAEALRSYLAAQAYICEANPVEADAARRAAALSRPMGQAAETRGDLERAYSLYESGGHYTAADRVMLALLRAKGDEPAAYDRAQSHFANRVGAFADNNKARIAATGGYQVDTAMQSEIAGWPTKACERALQREAQAFSESYLMDKQALYKARPDDLTDFAAMQALQAKGAAFASKWPEDQIKRSQELLRLALDWSRRITDSALEGQLAARVREVAIKRAQVLVQKFYGVPDFLLAAIDYYMQNEAKAQVDGVKVRARQLGADAEQRGALVTAADYYNVSGDDDKAQAAQDRAQQQARAKLQPSMDAMQKAADEMKRQYSDPAKVEAMKKQAEEMQRQMQKQQAQNAGKSGKSAEELESELGL